MPSIINIGYVNINTPQQNAGAFFGETVIAGWDANQKYNAAHGGLYGYLNATGNNFNYIMDGYEMIDGAINDNDMKMQPGGTV